MDETPKSISPNSPNKPGFLLLRLFVSGLSPRSLSTIQSLRDLIEHYLDGNYQLDVVDIYQQPELAREYQIIATPTLIKYNPIPKKCLVGNLSQTDRVLAALGLPA